jgi:rifampicin phosphotransferase
MTSADILRFDDAGCDQLELVGGKGANLGRLTAAGFRVPPGFCVTTRAYSDFVGSAGIDKELAALAARIDYADADDVERCTAEIRARLVEAPVPEGMAAAIADAYGALGEGQFVAVRSSGTAEDLAEASFAGQHDTYLDILGAAAVVDAVKRCWASLWTARATAYRHNKGFDHGEARLAVVVQAMVASDVSGVMFTGNPMTTATDEIVVNASWGLGEAIVSGIATPDQFVVKAGDLRIVERALGAKELRISRHPGGAGGTVTGEVPAAERERFSLDDGQLVELAALGRMVTDHYGGLPQDIEWALAGGTFYLLQSRPVTGVEFSWDADVDAWHTDPDDDDTIWTRAWADEVWTGAITPIMYSVRGTLWQEMHRHLALAWNRPDLASMRYWKFHKAEAYYNCRLHQRFLEAACPAPLRQGLVAQLPPGWRDEALQTPYRLRLHLWNYVRLQTLNRDEGVVGWLDALERALTERFAEACGLPDERLRLLSDDELEHYVDRTTDFEGRFYVEFGVPFLIYTRDVLSALAGMVMKWYDGDNPQAFTELITGVPKRTITMEENLHLWALAEDIRRSPQLSELFRRHENAAFFATLEDSEEGQAFLARYRAFLDRYGFRGHADRDIYFARRCEDPAVDYRALKTLLSSQSPIDPEAKERAVDDRRRAVIEDVVANLRRKRLGALRVKAFRRILDYALRALMARDNERYLMDRTTFTTKRALLEVDRRLRDRGILDDPRDFHFLTREELYDLLRGNVSKLPLVRAKIAGRRRDFDRFNAREVTPPPYLHRGRGQDLDLSAVTGVDGVYQGTGTSRGRVTGTARIVKSLDEIGRVKEGEILVCNSTDPGWTPVFIVVRGIVLESGGMLAHGSCLSREYGIPAVQVSKAMSLIPDGATITVDGDSGQVIVLEGSPTETPELVDATPEP